MQTFYEFYETIQESRSEFYIGKIWVRLEAITNDTFSLLAEANNTIPNPSSLQTLANPEKTQKWRATYQIPDGQDVTYYLTAQNMNEARRMLYDYLGYKDVEGRLSIAKSADIVPVNTWNELVKLLQYSMEHDAKEGRNSFDSIDTGDFHLLTDLLSRKPQFVKKNLDSLDPHLQYYLKRAYNKLLRRDLDKDLERDQGSYWQNKARGLVKDFGSNIRQKLAGIKKPITPDVADPQHLIKQQPILGKPKRIGQPNELPTVP